MELFEYLKLFEYCQKLLRPVPLSHSVQHCTRLNCSPFLIDFARVTCVRFVTHNEFDFTRQVAQLW